MSEKNMPLIEAVESLELLETENALRKSVIDACPFLIAVKDKDFRYITVNSAFCDFIGVNEERALGMTDFDLFPASAAKRQRKKDTETLQKDQGLESEVKLKKSWMDEFKKPFRYSRDASDIGVITIWRGIEKRKKLEEALRRESQRLSRIYQNIAAGISILNPDGKYLDSNETWLEMTGYSRDELLKLDMYSLTHEDHLKYTQSMNRKLLKGRAESYRIEKKYLRKDGSFFWGDVRVSALSNGKGKVNSLITVVVDITEKKELEVLKEDLNRIMQHDLKTPLNGIIGFPGVLKSENNLSERQVKILNLIEQSGVQMLNMINLSLYTCKMERGEYNYTPRMIDALGVVIRIVAENFALINIKKLSPRLRHDNKPTQEGDSYFMPAEELLFYSMMCNLIKNALEAAPEKTSVDIELFKEGESHIIKIHNSGAVPASIRESFFEKYVTFGKPGGSGLGAYSARLIAETMKGGISMTTSESEGTCITLSFPATCVQ
jgi:PAS domain S-box-containing protein